MLSLRWFRAITLDSFCLTASNFEVPGTGFLPEAWEIKIDGRSLPDVYRMRLTRSMKFQGEERIQALSSL
jgi:hypothetical protein